MADTPAEKPRAYDTMGQPAHPAPETSSGRLSNLSMDLGTELPKGQTKPTVQKEPDHGLETNIEGRNATLKRIDTSNESEPIKLGPDGKPVATDPPAAPVVKDPATETPEAVATPEALPTLPEFDAAKPETVEAYTKAFLGKDGVGVNMANLSADWQKNAKVAADGTITGALSESAYKFLETKGFDRGTIKAVEAGQVARITQDRQAVYTVAGGQQQYEAAVAWARDGGYTKAAAAKFNTDLNAGGQARNDAVALLVLQHAKANPPARRVSPAKTTGDAASPAGGPTGGVQPYANYSEYQTDLRKARSTNDQVLLDATRARLKVSPWYTK